MPPLTSRVKTALLAGGVAAVIGASAVGVAAAQTTPTPSPTPRATGTPRAGQENHPDAAAQQQKYLETLAGKLGVTVDKLRTAITETRTELGGRGPGGAPGGGDHGGRDGMPGIRMAMGQELDAVAQLLGMATDDLRTALRSGKSLAQVAQEKGKTAQNVIDLLVSDANARIDQLVANGRLTADQAAQMKQRAATAIPTMVNNTRPAMPAPGAPGGPRRDGANGTSS